MRLAQLNLPQAGSGISKTQALQTIISSLRSVAFHLPVMYGNKHGDFRRLTGLGMRLGTFVTWPYPRGRHTATAAQRFRNESVSAFALHTACTVKGNHKEAS